MNLTDTIVLKDFKEDIIPGVFGISFSKVNSVKAMSLFMKYINKLEKERYIDGKQAMRLELKFINIIQKR